MITTAEQNFSGYNALALAFVGDAEYSLRVRKMLAERSNVHVNGLHKAAVKYVCAAAQATAAAAILPLLSEGEAAVYRRGRNAHSSHTPKGASEAQYHASTGLEALFGYLSLVGDEQRLNELFDLAVQTIEQAENSKN